MVNIAAAPDWAELIGELDDGSSLIVVVDDDFVVRAASEEALATFGLPKSDTLGMSAVDLIHAGDLDRAVGAFSEAVAHPGIRPADLYRLRIGPGHYRSFDVSGETLMEGRVVAFRLTDLTERRRAEQLALEQIEVLELLSSGTSRNACLVELANLCERHIEGSLAIIHVENPDGLLEPVTTGPVSRLVLNRWLGTSVKDAGGNLGEAESRRLSHVELDLQPLPHWQSATAALAEAGHSSCVTTPALSPSGEVVGYLEVLRLGAERPSNGELAVHGLVGRLIGLILDRLSFEAALSEAAFTDDLTGLGNRRQMYEDIEALSKRGEPFGLLGIDLDQFAWINNNLGHAAGDALLVEVARRLESSLPSNATAFRQGGDEFVVLVARERRAEDLLAVAKGLLGALREPFTLGSTERRINASIGIAQSMGDGDIDSVLAQADAAMYSAKREGGAGVRLFSEPIGQELMRHMSLAGELQSAIENGELRLVFQPIVRLDTLAITGIEALVRWEHPVRGLLGPGEFVPLAEESSLILELDEWVIGEAGARLDRWSAGRAAGDRIQMWVNVSARSVMRADLVEMIERASKSGLGTLGVELTERDRIDHRGSAIATFNRLRDKGVPIAIDDFGTGRASLHRVVDFEPDVIKIDRSFVRRMVDTPRSRVVVESIIDLAGRLGATVTAEGVEDHRQLSLLQELGCQDAQGFLLGRPMLPSHVETAFGPDLKGHWSATEAPARRASSFLA